MTAASSGVCMSGVTVRQKGYKWFSKVAYIYLPIHGVCVNQECITAQAVSMTGCSLPSMAAVTVYEQHRTPRELVCVQHPVTFTR